MKHYIILFFLFFLFAGCEVPIDAPGLDETNSISVTSLAVAGEKLEVRVALTDDINSAKAAPYADNYVMWRMLKFSIPENPKDSAMFQDYYGRNILQNCEVTAIINGKDYETRYNPKTHNYECTDNYLLNPGDKIAIVVKAKVKKLHASGLAYYVDIEAHSNVVVPVEEPEIEIVEAKKVYSAIEKYEPLGALEAALDSAMVFRLRLKSNSPGLQFYRLKVSSIYYDETLNNMLCISTFRSNDPMLCDNAIESSFGPWPAWLTDVFANSSFYGDEYVLEVSSRLQLRPMNKTKGRYFEIELQPINRALMEYLTVLYRLRVAKDSYFSEPVSLPSNIEGGVGVFGAIGRSAKVRYQLPGEESELVYFGENL